MAYTTEYTKERIEEIKEHIKNKPDPKRHLCWCEQLGRVAKLPYRKCIICEQTACCDTWCTDNHKLGKDMCIWCKGFVYKAKRKSDVEEVMEGANCTRAKAENALLAHGGDIVDAIQYINNN